MEKEGKERKRKKEKKGKSWWTDTRGEGYEEEEADGKATSDSNTQDDVWLNSNASAMHRIERGSSCWPCFIHVRKWVVPVYPRIYLSRFHRLTGQLLITLLTPLPFSLSLSLCTGKLFRGSTRPMTRCDVIRTSELTSTKLVWKKATKYVSNNDEVEAKEHGKIQSSCESTQPSGSARVTMAREETERERVRICR